jgi:Type II CAAX prenyl endopeptidase Rce1-like
MTELAPARAPFAKLAFLLWAAGLIGALMVLPYAMQLTGGLAAQTARTGRSPDVLLAASLVQSAVLLIIAVCAGLWAARRLGLGAPILEAGLSGQKLPRRSLTALIPAAIIGAAAGASVIALDRWAFAPIVPAALGVQPPAWMGLLASAYGAIDEELLMRLGLLSLLGLGLRSLARVFSAARGVALPGGLFWTANILTAILFGLGHLPATAALVPLTPMIVLRAVVLNGLAGLAFGWLYRRNGLEAAMTAHFSADIVLHVLLPLTVHS